MHLINDGNYDVEEGDSKEWEKTDFVLIHFTSLFKK